RKRRRSRFRKKISRHFGYFWIRVFHAVVSRLPFGVGRGLCWVLGTAAYYLAHRERKIALQSLTRVYGTERSAKEIRTLAREVFRHTASTIIDWIILRRWSREKLLKKFSPLVEQCHRVDREIRASGPGGIAITGHFGNWELLSFFFNLACPGCL